MGTTRFQRFLTATSRNYNAPTATLSPPTAGPSPELAKLYANNTPRIFLELLTARSTTLVFLITYASFVLGFAIDAQSVYSGFSTGTYPMSGFTQTENVWTGVVTNVRNVISFRLSVVQNNFTLNQHNNLVTTASMDDIKLEYDAEVWACYDSDGCGTTFGPSKGTLSWLKVLTMKRMSTSIPISSVNQGVNLEVVPMTFQNQESVPSGGKVRSYYMKLNYTVNPAGLFYSNDIASSASSITYTADILQHQSTKLTSGIGSVILLFFALAALLGFVMVMLSQKKKWLSEQKWVCYYLAALILFINPIYCVIIWIDNASPEAVFAFYVFDAMAQATFVMVWLLFADSINRKRQSALVFYGPKFLISTTIFALYVTQTVLQLPSINPVGSAMNRRSPVEAVHNWSSDLQHSYSAVSIALLVSIGVWTVYWICTLVSTSQKLRILPYMNTRYLQLSFRFFFLQATLLAAYFVFQYGVVIYYLVIREKEKKFTSTNELTDFLNTLFRQQTQQFGKVVFLTVYAFVITFLYFPASLLDNDLATTLASTYVINESEKKQVEKLRGEAIARVVGVVSHMVDAKKEVFCIDAALKFCKMSYEAYYDVAGLKTESGYVTKPVELESLGYTLVETIYRPEHETFCFIARHIKLSRIVVCFRGTSCRKHWADNLNYAKKELSFPTLSALDAHDGLGICRSGIPPGPHGNEPSSSVNEEEEEVIDCEVGSAVDVDVTTSTYAAPPSCEPTVGEERGSSVPSLPTSPRPSTPRRSSTRGGGNHRYLSLAPVQSDDHGGIAVGRTDSRSPEESSLFARRCLSAMNVAPNALTNDDDDDSDVEGDDENERAKVVRTARESSARNETEGAYRERSRTVESTLERGMAHLFDATSNIVGGATELVVGVAAVTPGVKMIINPHVHSGFWEAYSCVREDLHQILRRELKQGPAHLFFIGHSLGGALATIAALDVSINTIPRVNEYYDRLARTGRSESLGVARPMGRGVENTNSRLVSSIRQLLQRESPMVSNSLSLSTRIPVESTQVPDVIPAPFGRDSNSRPRHVSFDDASLFSSLPDASHCQQPQLPSPLGHRAGGGGAADTTADWPRQRQVLTPISGDAGSGRDGAAKSPRRVLRRVKASMYSFGSPRVGNTSFAQLYNKVVPDSFRTVIDGDVVTSVPPTGYRHVGTEALVDNLGAGSIIVDPSFIERRLRTNTKSSVSVHSLLIYRKGLQGVKDAAEFMKLQASDLSASSKKFDAVRLALSATNRNRRSARPAVPQSLGNLAASVGSDWRVPITGSSDSKGHASSSSPADENHSREAHLADILVESPSVFPSRPSALDTGSRESSIITKLTANTANTPNGRVRDRAYEDAYHYAKNIEETEFLVSNISQQAKGTGVQPFDALIRMMMNNELGFSKTQSQTHDQTKTMTTADFITADEDDAQRIQY